ncbi:MAG: metallophosphoesterase [Erysipelotrichaceae bacterium]|nr:metallophosphoesterase [Erysipelotrichaceae bacterium]
MMEIKNRITSILISFYSLVIALFFVALRINYAGISKFLGADTNQSFIVMYLPIIVCILLWLIFVYSLYGIYKYPEKKIHSIITLVLNVIFTAAIGVIIYFGSQDYLDFILPHFYKSLLVTGLIIVFAVILFFPIKTNKKSIVVKTVLVLLIIISSIFIGYKLKINKFSQDAVVYAVEDEYQIVFSTSDNSLVWVKVGDKTYYDLYAGSMRSKDLVHKVCVPMEELDKYKEYTIYAQQMIYRGPFGAYKGDTISINHKFRPVDTNDGLNYYALSDIHESYDGAILAASKIENLDFIVMLGDTVSMVEYHENANATNYVANKITNGEIPVVYARGNHEIKGEMAEDLYKYVGSKNEKFYYTFKLGKDIKGVVLDIGEDHDDDWWEYFDSAQFDLYRDEQTALLQKLINENYFEGCKYKIVLSHIPITFVNARKNHVKYKELWTELINQMNVDISLSGHQHDITIFEPGAVKSNTQLVYNKNYSGIEGKTYDGYLTNNNFYAFLVGRCSNKQTGDTLAHGTKQYTGLYVQVDLNNKKETITYTNSDGEVVPVCNIFGIDDYQNEYVINLSTLIP